MLKYAIVSVVLYSVLMLFQADAQAQNFGNIDFSTQRVENLSDSQINQIWSRAQEEGLSVSEVGALARSRGMSSSQASLLETRLRDARGGTETSVSETQQEVKRDSLDERTEQPDEISRSQLERADSDREIPIYGMNLFRGATRSFEPAFNIPTPDDYKLGPGDELIINVWGAAEASYSLTVSPEGTIRISGIGPIFVDGMDIREARERIIGRLGSIFSGLREEEDSRRNTFADVSLGNVRSIKVTLIGEVRQPGTYTVNSLSTVFNALYAAGGPSSSGSMRSIQVIRGGEVAAELDIFDFLLHADQTNNIRLRDHDIVKIAPYNKRIELRGEVRRSAIFEVKDGETLGDVIRFAGGFTERAYTKRLVLHRKTAIQRSITDILWPEGSELEITDGDVLRVGQILDRYENKVTINGAVFRPGEYELDEGLTLTGLIEKAEGLREDVFMPRGIIFRTMDNLMVETIPFSLADILVGVAADVPLQKNDIVQISSLFDLQEEQKIRVSGAVIAGGEFEFNQNMSIKDAIFLADGFTNRAAPYRIEVARRITDGDRFLKGAETAEIFQFDVSEGLVYSAEAEEFRLKPFDHIFVRSMPNYQEQRTVRILGEVQFPGTYVLPSRNTRISEVIAMAGGLSLFAYTQGASLIRQQDDKVLDDIAMINERVRIRQANSGKVGIRLHDILVNPGSAIDLFLEPGDVLDIPTEMQTVRVEGEVLFPLSVRYDEGMSLRDFVNRAGGFSEQALRRRSYVIYANGEVDRTRNILMFRNYPEITPGATIVVPRADEKKDISTQERIAIWSSIVSVAAIVTNTLIFISRK